LGTYQQVALIIRVKGVSCDAFGPGSRGAPALVEADVQVTHRPPAYAGVQVTVGGVLAPLATNPQEVAVWPAATLPFQPTSEAVTVAPELATLLMPKLPMKLP
jgi:hypothetical protein